MLLACSRPCPRAEAFAPLAGEYQQGPVVEVIGLAVKQNVDFAGLTRVALAVFAWRRRRRLIAMAFRPCCCRTLAATLLAAGGALNTRPPRVNISAGAPRVCEPRQGEGEGGRHPQLFNQRLNGMIQLNELDELPGS